MDPDRHCLDEAAPPGSSLYYATLFTGARERAVLVAVHALRQALLGIVDTVADPGVRAPKLNWWSEEIMEARDRRPRHPVSVAITRHCGRSFWYRPEVLAMLSAVARASAESGFGSEAARDDFCEHVGGGTARLCAAALAAGNGTPDDLRALGAALESAMLAGAPCVRSGLRRIPAPASGPMGRTDHGGSGPGTERIAEARARAHRTLADAVGGVPGNAGPAALAYRTLAHLQLAALASALRKPAWTMPRPASITPLRKLWIAWRIRRRAAHFDP